MKRWQVVATSGFVLGVAACGAATSGVEDKPNDVSGSNDVASGSPDAGASLTAAGAPGSPDSGVGLADASTAGTGETDAGTGETDLGLRRGATLADLDTSCGSVTGRDVLALLKASYGSTFVYESNRSLSTALAIQTKHDHGAISCAPNFCPCDPPPPP